MSNCIHLKQKLNRTIYCKAKGKVIRTHDCFGCEYRDFNKNEQKANKKVAKSSEFQKNKTKMKNKSSKLAKLERDRFSLFTDDLEHCIICGKSPVNKHEIFYGSGNRQKSMKYGLVIPLCTCEHHNQIECKGIHFDTELQDEWRKKGQELFEETYPDLDFIQIFGRGYQ